MAGAQDPFRIAVDDALIEDPEIPIVGNVGADILKTADTIRGDLYGQLTSRVHWTESIRNLRKLGVKSFIELGSGSVLTGLLKRIDAEAEGIALGEPADFETLSS